MIVTLLTDYGRDDEFVGVCHGVIRRIAPGGAIVDITHGLPRYAVRQGALCCATAPVMPAGVHVAVVDPQVGTERRAIALRSGDGRILVGPDNGLLSLAWSAAAASTGRGHHAPPTGSSRSRRPSTAATSLRRWPHTWPGAGAGRRRRPARPGRARRVALPEPRTEDGALVAHALVVDRFGNVSLDLDHDDMAGTDIKLGATVEIEAAGERYLATYAQTFADVRPGELLVYEDAYRTLAVAINRGDAAGTLGVKPDAEVRLRPR